MTFDLTIILISSKQKVYLHTVTLLQSPNFYYNLYDDASFEWLSFAEDRYPSSNFYYGAYPDWRYDRFAYFPPFNWQPGGGIRVRSEESFALLEVPRRKLIVEASYPISHTTSWETDQEKRYVQFQEFKVVPKLDTYMNINTGGGSCPFCF